MNIVIATRRRRRGNLLPSWPSTAGDCFVAMLLAMTVED
jgi:hypothetical protein